MYRWIKTQHISQYSIGVKSWARNALIVVISVIISSCSTLPWKFEAPRLDIVSIEPVGLSGITPLFRVNLKMTNPNAVAIELDKIDYTITIEGFEVVEGGSQDIPVIAAGESQAFSVQARLRIISGLGLIAELLFKPRNTLHYQISAQFELQRPIKRQGKIEKKGEIAMPVNKIKPGIEPPPARVPQQPAKKSQSPGDLI